MCKYFVFFTTLFLSNYIFAQTSVQDVRVGKVPQYFNAQTEHAANTCDKNDKGCVQRSFVDNLNVPQSTKNVLYNYALTKEGQRVLDDAMNRSLLGPTASSISSPIGFSADWGSVSAGIGYVNRWIGTDKRDGFAGATVGFGDAVQYFGLSVSVLIDSINPFDGGFAENGTVSAQLFHVFPKNFALGVGVGNVGPWGVFKDAAQSYYVVGTKVFDFSIRAYEMPLTISLGAGTGAFKSNSDAQTGRDNNVMPFGSVGWRVLPRLSVIGEWVAQQTNVGISVVPIAKLPIVLSIADCNIMHNKGQNSFFMSSIAIGYRF